MRRVMLPVILGAALGVVGTAIIRRARTAAAAGSGPRDQTAPEVPAGKAAAGAFTCPLRFDDNGKPSVADAAEMERLRTSLMQGIFTPWVELGRAPTPEEVGGRLKLDPDATEVLLDRLATCGGAGTYFGIHRVPDSELIAVAWPFSNVPTGIEVTLEGKKPMHARCAVDALGVSKMMGAKAVVEGTARDGVPFRVEVDRDRLVRAIPADLVVVSGGSCDEIVFFSSRAALEVWKRDRHVAGRTLAIDEAVRRGAAVFGRFAEPFHN